MRDVASWNEYLMGFAYYASSRSKDPSTQVGAVLADSSNRIVGVGYNGFPPHIADTPERWTSAEKDKYVIHAEMNAILNMAQTYNGDLKLYCTLAPCSDCARLIVATGKITVVMTPLARITARLEARPELRAGYELMRRLFDEAGISYHEV